METTQNALQYKEVCAKNNANIMVEGDVIIPDVKPDIREILLVDADARVKAVEPRGGKLQVTGDVRFSILYVPDEEDGCEVKSLETVFPFSDNLELSADEKAEFVTNVQTEHIGFTLVNSRKLNMKVIVSVDARGYRNKTIVSVPEMHTEHIQYRTHPYQIYMPICETQTDIAVSDFLAVPSHLPDIDEILKVDVWANEYTCKAMNEKVMIRGTLCVKTLYTAAQEENQTVSVVHEIPFTEIIEAGDTDETCEVSAIFNTKAITTNIKGDVNGDTKMIGIELMLGLRLKTSKFVTETIADDCYCVQGELETKMQNVEFDEFAGWENTKFTETQIVTMPEKTKLDDILHITCKPIQKEIYFENGMCCMRGVLVTFMLYREDGGKVRSFVTETEFERKKPVAGEALRADYEIWLEDVTATKQSAERIEVKATIGICGVILNPCSVNMITECNWMESEEQKEIHPKMTIYFVTEGDTLWGIAKKYGTTVEKIKSINGLEGDLLSEGSKLLIV